MKSFAALDEVLTRLRVAGAFGEAELAHLPDAVQRYFRAGIAAGTPLALASRLRMRGKIKLGRWLPFGAREVLAPHEGFIWAARVAGVIVGSDQYAQGAGGMEWKVARVVPLMRAHSDDVARSAAERAAAEAIWVPTALLPRLGVAWTAPDERHITASFKVDKHPVAVTFDVDGDGRVRSLVLDRWGDPENSGTFALHPFGLEVSDYATFDGVTIPSEGRAGWYFGTDRWEEGVFFRYRITDLHIVT